MSYHCISTTALSHQGADGLDLKSPIVINIIILFVVNNLTLNFQSAKAAYC